MKFKRLIGIFTLAVAMVAIPGTHFVLAAPEGDDTTGICHFRNKDVSKGDSPHVEFGHQLGRIINPSGRSLTNHILRHGDLEPPFFAGTGKKNKWCRPRAGINYCQSGIVKNTPPEDYFDTIAMTGNCALSDMSIPFNGVCTCV